MQRRVLLLFLVAIGAVACSDRELAVVPPATSPVHPPTAEGARQHLAQLLAVALADPATRAAVRARLDASEAPEGKLQFQALARAAETGILPALVRANATTSAELLTDLDAARGLELYLPVPSQRAAWRGDARYLVATAGDDGQAPVAFDSAGHRSVLDPSHPPDVPVLALVPQETRFAPRNAANVVTCMDFCGGGSGGGGGDGGGVMGQYTPPGAPGLYLIKSHFTESFESWLKGQPEFEYHVYGVGDTGESVELACTAEVQLGVYQWDQNDLDWSGSVMLLSDADYKAYQARHPGSPIRIVAWEDDDEPCVDHVDVGGVSALITSVDHAYSAITSGKVDPWFIHGIRAAPSVFNLISALRNVILSSDDFIGNAVEGTITGDAPDGANWVVKTSGTITKGWFTTLRVP